MKNLPYAKAIYGELEKQAVKRALDSQWLSGYKETVLFERELAQWWGMKYAVAVNSGSSANFIALQSLDLPKGSEIITPAGGAFPTTIAPMVYLNHIPFFVDIDFLSLCLKAEKKAIGWNTKAIMFAHTLGFMPDMKRLMKLAKRYNLKVIEDCADAMGSTQKGQKAGTFGDLATVSFYPAHMMTTGGEGGAILTNNEDLYWKCRSIRDWGRDCRCMWLSEVPACGDRFSNPPFDHRYYYTNIGLNFKMTEMQAAFGREQLKRVNGFIRKRKRNYRILAESMGRYVNDEIVPFAYPMLAENKNRKMAELAAKGIHARAIFSGNILAHPAYQKIEYKGLGELENSQKLHEQGFFVGVAPHLSVEDMEYIAECLKGGEHESI